MRKINFIFLLGVIITFIGCSGVAREGVYLVSRRAVATETEVLVSRLAKESISPVKFEPLVRIYPANVIKPKDISNLIRIEPIKIKPQDWSTVINPRPFDKYPSINTEGTRGTALIRSNIQPPVHKLISDKFGDRRYYRYGTYTNKTRIIIDRHPENEEYPVRDFYNDLIGAGYEVGVCVNIDEKGHASISFSASTKGSVSYEITFNSAEGFDISGSLSGSNEDKATGLLTIARKGSLLSNHESDDTVKITKSICYPLSASGIEVETPGGIRSVNFSGLDFHI